MNKIGLTNDNGWKWIPIRTYMLLHLIYMILEGKKFQVLTMLSQATRRSDLHSAKRGSQSL